MNKISNKNILSFIISDYIYDYTYQPYIYFVIFII